MRDPCTTERMRGVATGPRCADRLVEIRRRTVAIASRRMRTQSYPHLHTSLLRFISHRSPPGIEVPAKAGFRKLRSSFQLTTTRFRGEDRFQRDRTYNGAAGRSISEDLLR